MSERLRLVIFDVDGTLIDSRAHILDAMRDTFEALALEVPPETAILQGVGLSLPLLMARLAADHPAQTQKALISRYRSISFGKHTSSGREHRSKFFPGMRDILDCLKADDFTLMATATGLSRRGLDRIVRQNGLEGYFTSMQVADDHPSKPHPAMIQTALSDTGVSPDDAVMIGDTSFDIDMAIAAGVRSIGVTWGNHPECLLTQADKIVATPEALRAELTHWIEGRR